MDRFDFFKEQYYKEHERRSEINNSLTQLIGYITAIVAVLYYFLTSFDFRYNWIDSLALCIITASVLYFLIRSMFHLIKAYTNLHHGFDVDYLADASDLNQYYQGLNAYYQSSGGTTDNAEADFKEEILTKLIEATDANQKRNKQKSFHRHMSQRFLLFAFALLILNVVPYAFNYALAEKPKDSISIEFASPLSLRCDSGSTRTYPDTVKVSIQSFSSDSIIRPSSPANQTLK